MFILTPLLLPVFSLNVLKHYTDPQSLHTKHNLTNILLLFNTSGDLMECVGGQFCQNVKLTIKKSSFTKAFHYTNSTDINNFVVQTDFKAFRLFLV